MKSASKSFPWRAAWPAALAVTALLPYANALRNGFVYDDVAQVLTNPYILNFRHLREIFTSQAWSYLGAYGATYYYRPMMNLGYLLCHQAFGMQAWSFHLANLMLHAGVVGILFALTFRLTGNRAFAVLTAFLFALHPVHTESVDWIGGITDVELAFFYLIAFWCFLAVARPGGRRSPVAQLGMVVSFVLAILSKEPAVTLAALAAVYEFAYRPDRRQTRWFEKLARFGLLWLISAGYVLFRVRFLGVFIPKSGDHRQFSLSSTFILIGQYFGKLLWPVHLCLYYAFHPSRHWWDPRVLGGLLTLVVLAAIFLALWRSSETPSSIRDHEEDQVSPGRISPAQLASFGIVWFLGTLSPVLSIRWMPENAFAERYLYLPSVGFCWLAAWAGLELWNRSAARRASVRPAGAAALGILAMACVWRVVTRNRDWKDEIVLFNRTLEVEPDAYRIRNDLGSAYWGRGDYEAAAHEWREVERTAPPSPVVLANLGLVEAREKHLAEAERLFYRSLRLEPTYTKAYIGLGDLYHDNGLSGPAEIQYRKAVSCSPLSALARNSLGTLYLEEGRLGEAETQFMASIDDQPTPAALDGLGNINARRGDGRTAERAFLASLQLYPRDALAHAGLGRLYASLNRTADAEREYQAALASDPGNAEAQAALEQLRHETNDGKNSSP